MYPHLNAVKIAFGLRPVTSFLYLLQANRASIMIS